MKYLFVCDALLSCVVHEGCWYPNKLLKKGVSISVTGVLCHMECIATYIVGACTS